MSQTEMLELQSRFVKDLKHHQNSNNLEDLIKEYFHSQFMGRLEGNIYYQNKMEEFLQDLFFLSLLDEAIHFEPRLLNDCAYQITWTGDQLAYSVDSVWKLEDGRYKVITIFIDGLNGM